MSDPAPSRKQLQSRVFADPIISIGKLQLRPLSPDSYELLGDLGNPLILGEKTVEPSKVFSAVVEYAWVHFAPVEIVAAIESRADLPKAAIRAWGMENITMPDAEDFLLRFPSMFNPAMASLAVPKEGEDAGKSDAVASIPTGAPPSSSPSVPPEIPSGSGTCSGSSRSEEPLPTSMPPTSPTAQPAAGPSTSATPPMSQPDLPSPSSPPSEPSGPV